MQVTIFYHLTHIISGVMDIKINNTVCSRCLSPDVYLLLFEFHYHKSLVAFEKYTVKNSSVYYETFT